MVSQTKEFTDFRFLTSAKDDIGIKEASNFLVEKILENEQFDLSKGNVRETHQSFPQQQQRGAKCCPL